MIGGLVTVNVAGLLIIDPSAFETRTWYEPMCTSCAELIEYEGELAPIIGAPLKYHWYDRTAVPVALTWNVAAVPAAIVSDAGPLTIAGGLPPDGVKMSGAEGSLSSPDEA